MMFRPGKRKYSVLIRWAFGLAVPAAIAFWFCLPEPLFNDPYSLMVLDKQGQLVGARISDDEQWRFQMDGAVPEKFALALITYEDKRFRAHPGVDPLAMARALYLNLRAGKTVSGGSTLTMQLMRMARKNRDRNITQKIIESILALRAELRYSKDEILHLYAAHAPFGGNTVGLEAASWRYFGKPPDVLSWAEAATLAVLPNSPGLIHPGRNRKTLRTKRDRLLGRMAEAGILSNEECTLASLEHVPDQPYRLPDHAPHFVSLVRQEHAGRVETTLDLSLQEDVSGIVSGYHHQYAQNEVHNMAVIVTDTESGEILAYIGNTQPDGVMHEHAVDMVRAERSSGSILKPFLYAAALEEGIITPQMLLPDIPTTIAGYRPENFHRSYEGKVPADEALSRSLNVPAVALLRAYGVERFRRKLKGLGFSSIHYSADHYGLPLILGGAEVTLWDLAGAYGSMGRALMHAFPFQHQYSPSDLHGPRYLRGEQLQSGGDLQRQPTFLHYSAIWSVFEAMKEVQRPAGDGSWEVFRSARQIHWKTGTSYGYRDAWAIGVTRGYTVGVWVGNADGEGRPGIIGVQAAAPVLLDVFRLLPLSEEFTPPFDALSKKLICRISGHPAGQDCPETGPVLVPGVFSQVDVCPYHKPVWTDASGSFQYHKACAGEMDLHRYGHFSLDPVSAYYYRRVHPEYREEPSFHPGCRGGDFKAQAAGVEITYPPDGAEIFLPVGLDALVSPLVCSATASRESDLLHWYLDNAYLGETRDFHSQKVAPPAGSHQLTVVHPSGARSTATFTILSGRKAD